MKIFKKIIKALVILLLLGAVGAGGYYYYRELQKEPPLAELYPTEPVYRSDVALTVSATGNVSPKESVSLYMSRTQTVANVLVKEGDYVSVDDILITYDTEQDKAELERKREQALLNISNAQLGLKLIGQPAQGNELLQYESDVSAAEKNAFDAENDLKSTELRIAQQQRKLDDALKTMNKNKELYAAGAITEHEYDLSVTAWQNASEAMDDLLLQKEVKERTLTLRETQMDEAGQRLQNATNKLSESANTLKYQQQENIIKLNRLEMEQINDDLAKLVNETVSPVTGYVEAVHVLEGGTAIKGGLLIQLADLSQTIIYADVTEYDAPQLSLGQKVSISTSGLPDKVYNGHVTKIAAGAVEKEKSSGTERVVPVEITVTDPDERLKTGYTVDLEFYLAVRNQVVSIPLQSVATEGNSHFAYVLIDETLEKREIVTGLFGDKRVEIVQGLSAGDPVVLNQAEVREKHITAAP